MDVSIKTKHNDIVTLLKIGYEIDEVFDILI